MNERKSSISLGILFWIAAILLVLVIFLFNRRNIEQVMKNTGFIEVIHQRIGIDPVTDETSTDKDSLLIPELETDSVSTIVADEVPKEDGNPISEEVKISGESGESSKETEETEESAAEKNDEEPVRESEGSESRARDYLIHLVHMDNTGRISLEAVERSVHFISSPLTETLKNLINEPREDGNYRNVIPPETHINKVWIQEEIAYIDLSEEFSFNPIGLEGYRLQVQQLIATATQFDSVSAVQILIDGELISFLGGDGLFIGQPLSSSDL
ncbi:MAG: GerMN domain-containing protein [Salinispira sp.]